MPATSTAPSTETGTAGERFVRYLAVTFSDRDIKFFMDYPVAMDQEIAHWMWDTKVNGLVFHDLLDALHSPEGSVVGQEIVDHVSSLTRKQIAAVRLSATRA
jgi:hypothetical protein